MTLSGGGIHGHFNRDLMDSELRVGDYRLAPLRHVRQDDLHSLLGSGRGVYICNAQEPAWYESHRLRQPYNYSIEKKHRMFAMMGPGASWVSPTFDADVTVDTHDLTTRLVEHLGYGRLRGRWAQLYQTIRLAGWLAAHRASYDYCFVYNFYLPTFVAPLLARAVLGKKLFVDYEDDYTTIRASSFKNMLERLLHRSVDGVSCISEGMVGYFPRADTRVFNTFADLSYAADTDFSLHRGMTFLYSGRLDDLRGADLIAPLARSLRARLGTFRLVVTGDGPLRSVVEHSGEPEVDYLGFLPGNDYERLVESVDVCVVLQRPDHPFSRGSFPSKVEAYASHHKPIFHLVPASHHTSTQSS